MRMLAKEPDQKKGPEQFEAVVNIPIHLKESLDPSFRQIPTDLPEAPTVISLPYRSKLFTKQPNSVFKAIYSPVYSPTVTYQFFESPKSDELSPSRVIEWTYLETANTMLQ